MPPLHSLCYYEKNPDRYSNLVLYLIPAMPLLIVSKNPPDMLILVLYLPLTMPLLIVSKNSRYADFSTWIVIY